MWQLMERVIDWLLWGRYYQWRCDRSTKKLMGLLHKRYGNTMPRYMHLACGWGGDRLNDGKCPQCGEPFPDY